MASARETRHVAEIKALKQLSPVVEAFLERMRAGGNPGTSRVSVLSRNWRGKKGWGSAKGWPLHGHGTAPIRAVSALLPDGRFVISNGARVSMHDLLARAESQSSVE